EVLAERVMQFREMPERLALGIDRLGHLADITRDLGIAFEVVDELGVSRAEEPLDHRSEPRFCWWAGLLGAFVPRQQSFEEDATEFSSPVDNEHLGQVRVAAYAFPQDHHTRAVTGGIEGQVHSKHTAAKGIRDQRQPRSSQCVASAGTDELHIELGVVDMPDFKGTIAVTWCLPVELPVRRFVLVGGPPPQSLQYLPKPVTLPAGRTKRRVTRCADATVVAFPLQHCPASEPGLVLQRLVIILDGLEQKRLGRRREPAPAVSSLTSAWQESEIPAAKTTLRLSIA